MKMLQLTMIKKSVLIAVVSLALSAASSFALSFTLSEGLQPANVGTITLSQVNGTTVNVLLDLQNPTYGLLNTGGPHTPFTFNLAGTETGVTASFIQPLNGVFSFGLLSLNLGGGDATPFGSYGVAIDSNAGNGSGNAYYGDLEFNLIRASGLTINDFIANAVGYYFAADLTDGQNTGSQAWKTPGTPNTSVPDAGSAAMLLGAALAGLGMMARRIKQS